MRGVGQLGKIGSNGIGGDEIGSIEIGSDAASSAQLRDVGGGDEVTCGIGGGFGSPVFTFGVDNGTGGAEIVISDGRGGGAVMGVGSMLVCVQTLMETGSGSDWVPESSKIWAAVRQC